MRGRAKGLLDLPASVREKVVESVLGAFRNETEEIVGGQGEVAFVSLAGDGERLQVPPIAQVCRVLRWEILGVRGRRGREVL